MAHVMAVFAAVLFILTLSAPSAAATRTWTGGGAPSDVWSNPNNWDTNVIPVDGDDLVFPNGTGATTTNDLPNLLVQSLSIASSRTFTGAGISAPEHPESRNDWRRADRTGIGDAWRHDVRRYRGRGRW